MMSIETIKTDPNWGSLQGTTLEGGYELTEILGADTDAATFKLRVLGDYSRKSLVRLFRASGEAATEQLSIWEAAKSLAHPNLSCPQAMGRTQVDGTELIYVVLARPDENLAGVLRERALTNDEAAEVLLSLTRALEHLHAHGFVHGCVSPEQVLAIGDSISLSTECLRRINTPPPVEINKPKYLAPEQTGENITPGADVWCLGATIFQALTQKQCGADCAQQAGKLSGAFARVLPRCLDADPQTRCKLNEVASLYKSAPAPVGEAKPRPAVSASAVNRPIPNGRAAAVNNTPSAARPKPIVVPPRRSEREPEERKPRAWIYIAVAALAVLLFIWLAHPRRRAAVAPVPAPPPDAAGKAWPTQTLSPDGGATTAPAKTPPATAPAPQKPPAVAHFEPPRTLPQQTAPAAGKATGGINGPIWRVVLYTYNREADAQKMAQAINQKHAGLGAEVFSPKGNGSPYLVVIGGEMNRDEAARLRRKAVAMGLPHDSYIQNFKK